MYVVRACVLYCTLRICCCVGVLYIVGLCVSVVRFSVYVCVCCCICLNVCACMLLYVECMVCVVASL